MPIVAQTEVVDSLSLLALKCASRVFDLSTRLHHVSMRDQIVRAQLLARDLRRFDVDARRVLVVGAGLAGVSFAVEAAEAGFEVVVLETGSDILELQAQVTTRYVGPFLYEWPSTFCNDQTYPPTAARHLGEAPKYTPQWGLGSPVTAAEMAGQVRLWLKGARKALGDAGPALWFDIDRLEVTTFVRRFVKEATANYQRWRAGLPLQPMPTLAMRSGNPDPANPRTAPVLSAFVPDYVVLAAGMGRERTALPLAEGSGTMIEGAPFWKDDTLKKDPRIAHWDVGVVGGGDGALQDVLRLLTRFDHPLDWVTHLRQDPRAARLLDREHGALLAMEQQSRLLSTWTLGSAVFAEVDHACREVATRLAREPAIRRQVASSRREGGGRVTHFVKDHHFGKAYLLNRFAVHLIDACSNRAPRGRRAPSPSRVGYRLFFGTEVLEAGDAPDSSDPIRVSIRQADGSTRHFDFDTVIVRLGLDQSSASANQMIQLSDRDNGLRTALAQVPLPFVASRVPR